jgi:Phage integrase, N-terminal SAM-like domain
MESQLEKHILPRFGDLPLDAIDEMAVQEFVADLKRATFEMRRPKGKSREHNGSVVKTYKLSRKTILNIVGVVKLVLGRKVWLSWQLDLGKPEQPRQRSQWSQNDGRKFLCKCLKKMARPERFALPTF